MRAILRDNLLVLLPEHDAETTLLSGWKVAHTEHVLHVRDNGGNGLELHDLGLRADACREPINVVSNSPDPGVRLISNFAHTPFALDGETYQTVESYWQGLKFPQARDRSRIAALEGAAARREGERQGYGTSIIYAGATIHVGTWPHWQLMERACLAKFEQSTEARDALLATSERPLVHIVRRDSKAIPGVIMADIWMRLRRRLSQI